MNPRTPVLVGIGVATQREEDPARAMEPLDLMLSAARNAGADALPEPASLLASVGRIGVPKGRWRYQNPGGEIARAIGAEHAVSLLASVGVLQQTLIGDACRAFADREADTTLVVGGDAGYRTCAPASRMSGPGNGSRTTRPTRSSGAIAGYTVLYERGKPPRGVAVVDVDDARTVVQTEDPALVARMESGELCGTPVRLGDHHSFTQ